MIKKLHDYSITGLFALLIVAMLVWMVGCTPVIQTKYITTELHHKPRPTGLPKVSADEIQCLSKETVGKIAEREFQIGAYAKELEAIIDSTTGKSSATKQTKD